ncbi:hypothetical protein D9756_001965 [Leucocoprinus leucothites]|uniref:DUF6593 domain-containing protein n=1 Tax=Leucocoprinus leucothites TaxID=201217 RepID=A0A8H5G5C5_9AGAR|nr:hypothetical protein D9756_001965 [Leucoagaricus leucothites]
MNLYLVPDNPENTTFVSANGTAHFRVTTMSSPEGSVTYLQRPSENLEDGLLAEIRTARGKKATIVASSLLEGAAYPNRDNESQGFDASLFLHRKGRFDASSRYFTGNDGAEYRWKYQKSLGWTLTQCSTGEEIAQQVRWFSEEGVFAGQERSALRINPCSVDIELVVLSFVMAEKKRRPRIKSKADESKTLHAEDVPLDGAVEGAEAETGTEAYGEL